VVQLFYVDVGNVANVSEIHAASIFMVKVLHLSKDAGGKSEG
jgi:hypothetical protein